MTHRSTAQHPRPPMVSCVPRTPARRTQAPRPSDNDDVGRLYLLRAPCWRAPNYVDDAWLRPCLESPCNFRVLIYGLFLFSIWTPARSPAFFLFCSLGRSFSMYHVLRTTLFPFGKALFQDKQWKGKSTKGSFK
jgi:hypothetical protein